jgi:hypothetical protein
MFPWNTRDKAFVTQFPGYRLKKTCVIVWDTTDTITNWISTKSTSTAQYIKSISSEQIHLNTTSTHLGTVFYGTWWVFSRCYISARLESIISQFNPWYQASAAILMRSALFWDITQRRMVILYHLTLRNIAEGCRSQFNPLKTKRICFI